MKTAKLTMTKGDSGKCPICQTTTPLVQLNISESDGYNAEGWLCNNCLTLGIAKAVSGAIATMPILTPA